MAHNSGTVKKQGGEEEGKEKMHCVAWICSYFQSACVSWSTEIINQYLAVLRNRGREPHFLDLINTFFLFHSNTWSHITRLDRQVRLMTIVGFVLVQQYYATHISLCCSPLLGIKFRRFQIIISNVSILLSKITFINLL